MIVTHIEGNLADLPADERERLDIDYAVFDNESRLKRVQRVRTESGAEIALRLGREVREINDADVLTRAGDRAVVAKIAPSDVLVIQPAGIKEALETAHALGNRHLQAQFFGADSQFGAEAMVVRYDHTVKDYLDHAGVAYRRGEFVMPQAFRHAEHTH